MVTPNIPSLLALTVGGDTRSALIHFHTHNDDRILLRLLCFTLITVMMLSVNNLFGLKYKFPMHLLGLEYVQLYVWYVVSAFLVLWYAFFLVATWFGRGFQPSEDVASIAQPCTIQFQRTMGHGTVCWLPQGHEGWRLFSTEMEQ